MRYLTLSPIETAPKIYDFVAFDTEGDGSRGGFICAAAFDSSGAHYFATRSHLRDYLFSRGQLGKKILAANLEYNSKVSNQDDGEKHNT